MGRIGTRTVSAQSATSDYGLHALLRGKPDKSPNRPEN